MVFLILVLAIILVIVSLTILIAKTLERQMQITRRDLLARINQPLEKEILRRRISLSGKIFSLEEIKKNPSLIKLLEVDDVYRMDIGKLFSSREKTEKNFFLREIHAVPPEETEKNFFNLLSGERFPIKEIKKNPGLLRKFSPEDFKKNLKLLRFLTS